MRLHRFYTPDLVGLNTDITVRSIEQVDQVRKVFRLKTGDSLVVFDGSGFDYECRIADFDKEKIDLNVIKSERSHFIPGRNIYLFAAVVKKDTFEWIVEKATELGVTHIVPVMAERSEKKSLNEQRLKKISIEAGEQSGRGSVPEILPIMSLEKAIDFSSRGVTSMVAFHTEGDMFDRSSLDSKSALGLFIGPEGGWSDGEIDMFHKNKIPVACLGNQVLRAETAVVAALSQVVFNN